MFRSYFMAGFECASGYNIHGVEIDQVAATAKLGCPLQERRLVSGVQQPVGKRGSRDPCANNQDPHFGYLQRAIRQP